MTKRHTWASKNNYGIKNATKIKLSSILTFYQKVTNMLTKRTSKNHVTIPKAVHQAVGETDYYEVSTQNGKIILTPVQLQQAEAVRAKLESLGLTEQDIVEAVRSVRGRATMPARRVSTLRRNGHR